MAVDTLQATSYQRLEEEKAAFQQQQQEEEEVRQQRLLQEQEAQEDVQRVEDMMNMAQGSISPPPARSVGKDQGVCAGCAVM